MSKPCKRGHTGPRYKSGGCIECAREAYTPRPRKARGPATGKKARLADGRRRSDVPEYLLLWRAKHRAARKELAFELEIEDIIIPKICPVLGIPMDSPSLDRMRSNQGYVQGNVRVISTRANALKSNATLQELELILADARVIGTP